jgi:GntR family transcriptional regulator / MocR family aminotransferase
MKASSGIEVMVRLERGSGEPLRAQLERQLRDSVRAGALRHGVALPSSRALATELGIARGVVTEAYTQLAAEGYLVSSQGAPTRVAAGATAAEAAAEAADEPRPPRHDFVPGQPDPALFPRTAWATAVREALRDAPDARFGYGHPWGAPELRRALSAYLGRARGVVTPPEGVIVTAGVTQGLMVACRTLKARGVTRLAVEEPGSIFMRTPLAALLELVPVPVDAKGLDVEALARSKAEAVLITPAHQYPTGVVLAPERRAALREWGGWVLEDDYDAEFRYDRAPVGALQGLDPEHVIYLSSISKTLAPALRMGWLVPPPSLLAEMKEAKRAADRGSAVLEQLGLAVLLERGELDRHLRRSRLEYRRRRDALVAALARHIPAARPHGAAAGLHLLVELPGIDEAALLAAAPAHGIGLEGLSEHTTAPAPPAVILGYGGISEPAIEPGIRALAELVLRLDGEAPARQVVQHEGGQRDHRQHDRQRA